MPSHPTGTMRLPFLLAMTKCSVFFLCLLPGSPQPGMCGPATSWQRALRGCHAPVQVLTSPPSSLSPSAHLSLPGSHLILLLKCTSENKPHQLPLEAFQRHESPPVPSSPLVSTVHGCHPHCPPVSVLMPSGSSLGCKAGGAGEASGNAPGGHCEMGRRSPREKAG